MRWKSNEIALIGKMDDREVAKKTGRTLSAVRNMKHRLNNGAEIPDDSFIMTEIPLARTLTQLQKEERIHRLMIEYKVRLKGR